MKGMQYNRKSIEKFAITGVIGPDHTRIDYTDKDGDSRYVNIDDVLKRFEGKTISFAISTIKDENLLDDGEFPEFDDEDEEDAE